VSLLDRVGRFFDDVLLLPEELRAALDEGDARLAAGEAREAAVHFEHVLSERAALPRASVGLAKARALLGEVRSAREAIEGARAEHPDDVEVALVAAELALRDRDAEAAAVAARDAARRLAGTDDERFADACMLRARAELLRSRPDRAARELRKAITARPTDDEARVALVEALVAAGRPAAARTAAHGIARGQETLDVRQAGRFGAALVAAGATELAVPWLERAAEAGDAAALVLLAQRCLAAHDLPRAEELARHAVAHGAGTAALAALAEVLVHAGRAAEASEAFLAAAGRASDDEAACLAHLRAAARVAPADAPDALLRAADALERLRPADPPALAARSLAHLARGEHALASQLLATAAADAEPRVLLARAQLSLLDRRPAESLAALDRLSGADSPPLAPADVVLAAALRREAERARWRDARGELDLAGALDAVARFCRERGESLAEALRRTTTIREALDQPLLLAVLGEFNAGKSTLVNAYVGAEVAPTGVVPTTATLNLLRAGADRRVRVVRRDGTTREGAFEEARALLAAAAAGGEGGGVDRVEISLPSETLERVWILDTPGTNALDPAHEALAREALVRADAVLWIFSAGQAGKESEGRMLARLAESRRVVVPVLNKADRLSADDVRAVRAQLLEALPDLRAEPIAVSAREALRARLAGDDAAYVASGFPALLESLEREVFSRARPLKRAASAGRLLEVLDDALTMEAKALADFEARLAALEARAAPLARLPARLAAAIDDALLDLATALELALADAAAEVLTFVRPRTHRFARHGVDREDRAFLAEVLERRVAASVEHARVLLVERAAQLLLEAGGDLAEDAARCSARSDAAFLEPLAAFVGYQRGLLAGGALDRFFADVLPRSELVPEAILPHLAAAVPALGTELRPGLLDAASDLVQSLEAVRASAIQREQDAREALRRGTYAPLSALREALADLVEARAPAPVLAPSPSRGAG
jgi:GTP-binding protein EngB required for normal cell division